MIQTTLIEPEQTRAITQEVYRIYQGVKLRLAGGSFTGPGRVAGTGSYRDGWGTCWTNQDNLLGGRLGDLFFLLAFYKQTREPDVWTCLSAELSSLKQYVQSTPTHNYSLGYGRFGVAYLYLELYRYHGNPQFLRAATELTEQYYQGNAFGYNLLENNGLFNGWAGMLLFTLHLYALGETDRLGRYIEQVTFRLLHKAKTGAKGLYWGGVTDPQRKNLGLARGNAGIAYVFGQLGRCFDNKTFVQIAGLAFAYEEERLRETDGGWDDHPDLTARLAGLSLEQGLAGMALSRLFLHPLLGRQDYLAGWNATAARITRFARDCQEYHGPLALDNGAGLGGLGLALLEGYKITRDREQLDASLLLAAQVTRRLHAGPARPAHEWNHAGCFLLNLLNAETGEPGMLLPALAAPTPGASAPLFRTHEHAQRIGEMMVGRDFKKTLALMKAQLPQSLAAFVQEDHRNWPGDFEQYVRSNAAILRERAGQQPRSETWEADFEREAYVVSLRGTISEADFQDENEAVLQLDELMGRNEPELLEYCLVIAPSVRVLHQEPVADLSATWTEAEIMGLLEAYKSTTFFFRVNAIDNLEETNPPGFSSIILDQFATPRYVHDVCETIVAFITRQNSKVLNTLRIAYGAEDYGQLIVMVRTFVFDEIKHYFMEGILEKDSSFINIVI